MRLTRVNTVAYMKLKINFQPEVKLTNSSDEISRYSINNQFSLVVFVLL